MLALNDAQLEQLMTTAYQIPRAFRGAYLQRVADERRGKDFGDADVHRACQAAVRAITVELEQQHRRTRANKQDKLRGLRRGAVTVKLPRRRRAYASQAIGRCGSRAAIGNGFIARGASWASCRRRTPAGARSRSARTAATSRCASSPRARTTC